MNLSKGEIIEFDIESIAFGGNGLGRYEGRVVFVNGAMEGDRVKASLTRIKKDFMEAKLVEITSPSKDRIEPRCPYFDRCGGCSFQFMPYEKQLEVKRQHVIDAFERIGHLKNPPVEDIIGCAEAYYYRNKMEFSFGFDAGMKFALGMHLPGRRFDILDLNECHLQSPLSSEIVNVVRDFCLEKNWRPFKFSIGRGFLRQLYIREGKRTGEVMVNMAVSDDLPNNFENDFKELADQLVALGDDEKKVTSIYWSEIISKRGTPRQTKEHFVYGRTTLAEKLILENKDELDFEIRPQAFFQVNTFQAEILYSQVVKLMEGKRHKCVFDLFCGTGTIGLFAAKHADQVWGIELNPEAIKAARENAQKNNIFNIDFFGGDVNKVLNEMREIPDLIIIDPPRAGLAKKIIKTISDFGANEIIYVSCNPSTLARDCDLLSEFGFKVEKIIPVDMFPHSYHIESVCLLQR
jgi:23S rRNA (uracil1939-C5)-methyltransferase